MAATATITGVVGAGIAITAKVFTGVLRYTVDTVNNLLTLWFESGVFVTISVNAATTVTGTKSGNTWTLVIS